MRIGQYYIVNHTKAVAQILEMGRTLIRLRWIIQSDGIPVPADRVRPNTSIHKRQDVQDLLDSGEVTILDYIPARRTDPNAAFLMRKRCDVHS